MVSRGTAKGLLVHNSVADVAMQDPAHAKVLAQITYEEEHYEKCALVALAAWEDDLSGTNRAG